MNKKYDKEIKIIDMYTELNNYPLNKHEINTIRIGLSMLKSSLQRLLEESNYNITFKEKILLIESILLKLEVE